MKKLINIHKSLTNSLKNPFKSMVSDMSAIEKELIKKIYKSIVYINIELE